MRVEQTWGAFSRSSWIIARLGALTRRWRTTDNIASKYQAIRQGGKRVR